MSIVLSMDVMGGDKGPSICLQAVRAFHKKNSQVKFIVHGCKDQVKPCLKDGDEEFMDIRFSESFIKTGEKKAHLLAKAQSSSLMSAIKTVKSGEAHGVMSMGETGAIALLSHLVLGKIKGLSKCALVACVPSVDFGRITLLDVGSNVERSAESLISHSIIGGVAHSAIAMATFSEAENRKTTLDKTRVAILNVGGEENKGDDCTRQAHKVLTKLQHEGKLPFSYVGFTEPQKMLKGGVDVIVVDGFSGNIMIKSMESGYWMMRYAIMHYLSHASIFVKMLFSCIVKPLLKQSSKRFSPKSFNGALFAGVKGVVVKSHGYSDVEAMISGIEITRSFVEYSIVAKIASRIQLLDQLK